MNSEQLIEILKQNPKMEIVIVECKKYEDNIPYLPIHSVEKTHDDDGNEFLGIHFITHNNK